MQKENKNLYNFGNNPRDFTNVLLKLGHLNYCVMGGLLIWNIKHIIKWISDCKLYDKEYEQLDQIYNDFIDNYNNLNRTLELQNPMDIFVMFSNLLALGYFSKDMKFEFDDNDSILTFGINMGTVVFTGEAVCRHIATMLTDIFLNYNIEASNLSVKYDFLISNHLITTAIFQNKKYFLDPTNFTIFVTDAKNRKKLICYDEELIVQGNYLCSLFGMNCLVASSIINNDLECANLIDFKRSIKKIKRVFSANLDIINQFYNDNKELYRKANDKLLVLTKSMPYINFNIKQN